MTVNWLQMKTEYISTNISHRKLAEKYSISYNTIRDRAIKEQWSKARTEQRSKITAMTEQKIVAVVVSKEVDRIKRILAISDKLIDKLEKATEQLNKYMVTDKTKTTKERVEKNKTGGADHITVAKEELTLKTVVGIINKAGLKQLASTLKDIKDIQSTSDDKRVDTSLMEALLNATIGDD